MSMEDLVRFAEEGVLPDGLEDKDGSESEASGEVDMNALSVDDLLAMADGEAVAAPVQEEKAEDGGEATEDELRALLGDTLSEEELGGGDEERAEIAKGIDREKLRHLANHIDKMAPAKLFPPRKDEIYYFLASVSGQTPEMQIEEAEEKCAFIGGALEKLESYMVSEAGFSMDEQLALVELFAEKSKGTIEKDKQHKLVFENFKFGWKQTLKKLLKDMLNLKRSAKEPRKPLWLIVSFYECLSIAYGLCRASENLKEYEKELGTEMTKENRRSIVDTFELMIEMAPYYGLKSIDFINRKQAYDAVATLDLPGVLKKLKEKKIRR